MIFGVILTVFDVLLFCSVQMVSKPSFLIEINKGGSRTLAIQCVFPPPDDYPSAENDQGESYGKEYT
jgi:hypothetical protein